MYWYPADFDYASGLYLLRDDYKQDFPSEAIVTLGLDISKCTPSVIGSIRAHMLKQPCHFRVIVDDVPKMVRFFHPLDNVTIGVTIRYQRCLDRLLPELVKYKGHTLAVIRPKESLRLVEWVGRIESFELKPDNQDYLTSIALQLCLERDFVGIEMAAYGCINGSLSEWPVLNAELRDLGFNFPSSTPASTLILVCALIWEKICGHKKGN
jgi:hypothetical protein